MFRYEILGSSSKGNCYLLHTSKATLILECGLHYKEIYKALDFDLSKVAGCLITHEHNDHAKEAKHLAKMGVDIYASVGTLNKLKMLDHHRSKFASHLKPLKVGEFEIIPFNVQHDAEEPLGFLIEHPEMGRLLFATDTFYIKYTFPGLNYIMVECNYSKEILDRNDINPTLKKRILSSHLSIDHLLEFLQANDLSQVKEIILMHLSDSNSHEKDFIKQVQSLTGIPVKTITY